MMTILLYSIDSVILAKFKYKATNSSANFMDQNGC